MHITTQWYAICSWQDIQIQTKAIDDYVPYPRGIAPCISPLLDMNCALEWSLCAECGPKLWPSSSESGGQWWAGWGARSSVKTHTEYSLSTYNDTYDLSSTIHTLKTHELMFRNNVCWVLCGSLTWNRGPGLLCQCYSGWLHTALCQSEDSMAHIRQTCARYVTSTIP